MAPHKTLINNGINKLFCEKCFDMTMPLGSIDSKEISRESWEQLFLAADEFVPEHHQNYYSNPSIIIGRRGSGKTMLLNEARYSKRYAIVCEIEKFDAFREVKHLLERYYKDSSYTVEGSVKIWEKVVFMSIFEKMHESNLFEGEDFGPINDFMDLTSERYYQIMGFGDANHRTYPRDEYKAYDKKFKTALEYAKCMLKAKDIKGVILIDNLEDYAFIDDYRNETKGLLKLAGQFNSRYENIFHMKLCLPSEMYNVFRELSSNANKDLDNSYEITWKSRDILLLVAKRLHLGLSCMPDDVYRKKYLSDNPSLKEAKDFVKSFFNPFIENRLKQQESSISYILRHTQLLPRHALMYFNRIFSTAIKEGKLLPDKPIPDKIVRDSICEKESFLADEVYDGFKKQYPNAKKILGACVGKLEPRFSYTELQGVYNKLKKFLKESGRFSDVFESFKESFMRMGCLGTVSGKTDFYTEGSFLYSVKDPIKVDNDSELCLHPIFSTLHGSVDPKNGSYAILPIGTRIEENDEL